MHILFFKKHLGVRHIWGTQKESAGAPESTVDLNTKNHDFLDFEKDIAVQAIKIEKQAKKNEKQKILDSYNSNKTIDPVSRRILANFGEFCQVLPD